MTTSVVAACDIAEGTSSLPGVGPIDLSRLFEKTTPTMTLHADIFHNCLRISDAQSDAEWARCIAVAKNCHEQNLEITNTFGGLILRTTRNIKAGNELFVWVGTDLLSRLEFPFLKPSNIKGNQEYHCHRCGCIFEDPNPLKVHLSFFCQKQEVTIAEFPKSFNFNRVEILPYDGMNSIQSKVNIPIVSKDHILFNRQFYCAQPALPNNVLCTNKESDSCRTFDRKIEFTSQQPVSRHPMENSTPSVSIDWKSDELNCSHSPKGHICAFCGKVYSRKYGLKIHVRTHTGYKPLKCKYCFRPFSDPSNLNKHVRLHSETDAPYRCLRCGKVLVRRRDLERHVRSRHPEIVHEEGKQD